MSIKLKDLPDDFNILSVKFRMPEEHYKYYQNYSDPGTTDVYIVGWLMGDFFISQHAPSVKQRSLHPLPIELTPQSLLEWELISSGEEMSASSWISEKLIIITPVHK